MLHGAVRALCLVCVMLGYAGGCAHRDIHCSGYEGDTNCLTPPVPFVSLSRQVGFSAGEGRENRRHHLDGCRDPKKAASGGAAGVGEARTRRWENWSGSPGIRLMGRQYGLPCWGGDPGGRTPVSHPGELPDLEFSRRVDPPGGFSRPATSYRDNRPGQGQCGRHHGGIARTL